ncbi:MAG: GerMN domain-containing protein [Egibacteraceae bacterium]
MRADFEERLRRALEARAAEVTPDPSTWRKVQARIDRGRSTVRFALPGAIAAVAVLAVILARPLYTRTQIELVEGERRPATQPAPPPPEPTTASVTTAPAPAVTTQSVPPPRYCGSAGGVAVVLATPSGDLAAGCAAGGTEPLTQGAEIDAHPVTDGSVVWFDRHNDGDPVVLLMELDLATGRLSASDSGAWPALSPDGKFAYVVDVRGDGRQPEIIVRSGPHKPIFRRFPVFKEGAEERSARHLAFDVAGDRVFWEAGYEGFAVWTSALATPEPIRLGSTTNKDAALMAPASGEPGTLTAISRCCVKTEGDRPTTAKLVRQSQRGTLAELADLSKLDGFDVGAPELFLAPAGQAILKDGRWSPGPKSAWLVGDGHRLFLVDADGKAALVSDNATSGVVDASPAQTSTVSPSPRLVTVQIYLARKDATDCKTTFAVPRQVTAPAVLRGALTELLAGPTRQERAQGYGGLFSSATEGYLRDVRLGPDGVAYVDFRDLRKVLPDASSSCGSSVLLSQLNATVTQFRTVKAVRYSINSDETAFSEWLQRSPPP